MSILVTGGAGFIGSHTCVELLNSGYDVAVVDNLYNASEKALERVKEITGKEVGFYKVDIRDREGLNKVFDKENVEAVIHFAGLKAVGESVQKPLEYYEKRFGYPMCVGCGRCDDVCPEYISYSNCVNRLAKEESEA